MLGHGGFSPQASRSSRILALSGIPLSVCGVIRSGHDPLSTILLTLSGYLVKICPVSLFVRVMRRIHTHYDNLMVSRNASSEVIRAAYKALALKWHPDVNPHPEAARVMKIINKAYEVLSDSSQRAAYDVYLKEVESTPEAEQNDFSNPSPPKQEARQPPPPPSPTPPPKPQYKPVRRKFEVSEPVQHVLVFGGLFAVIMLFTLLDRWSEGMKAPYNPSPPSTTQPVGAKAPLVYSQPVYRRPGAAPNGAPWPDRPSYVAGYDRLNTNGLSSVTVDNTQNESDVFVKLVSLDGETAHPVRTFYIPAWGSFKVQKIAKGEYEVRYRDLSDGHLWRTEKFKLQEFPVENGVRFSNMTLTLYKVPNGNMRTYPIDEAEF